MVISAIRKAPLAALLMLGCSAIAVPAQAGWFDFDSKPAAKTDAKTDAKAGAKSDTKSGAKADAQTAPLAAVTLDDSIQQAQMLRLARIYPDAIKHLSQLMMVASDDPRVISEYGKTLAAMGRAQDAVNFLTRAQQLQPNDWTVYSALGVAYDQTGDQKSAQLNYEQALKLKPEEASILSNYALSRMLAKDPEMARKLALRAESAGGGSDTIIGRNIAMIRSLAPEAPVQQVAQAPVAAPQAPVAVASLPPVAPVTQTPVAAAAPVASTASKAPVAVASTQTPTTLGVPSENRVVMQKVPVDPLAGPVAAKPNAAIVATTAPRPLQAKPAEAPAAVPAPVKTAEAKPQPAPVKVTSVPVKLNQPVPLTASKVAVAPIKIAEPTAQVAMPASTAKAMPTAPVATFAPLNIPGPAANKVAMPVFKIAEPVGTATAPVATAKASAPVPVKAADAKPATASVTVKMAAPVPVKADAAKPEAAPKVLASTAPAKTADAKPVAVKTVGQSKDAIPGLRLSANAY